MRVRFQKAGVDHAIALRSFWDEDKTFVSIVEVYEAGQSKSARRFDDDFEPAFRAFHLAVAEIQRSGLDENGGLVIDNVVVDAGAASEARFNAFPKLEEDAIDCHGDLETWAVLVDAWLEAGDVRGVVASVASASVDDPSEFLRRRQASEKARCQAISSLYQPLGLDGYRVAAKFERGLVNELRFEAEEQAGGRPLGELASLVLAHPMCRFIASLCAKACAGDLLLEAVVGVPSLRTLRTLRLHSRTRVELSQIDQSTPNLEVLELSSRETIEIAKPFAFPRLSSLTLQGRLSRDSLDSLLPSLVDMIGQTSIAIDAHQCGKENYELVSDWLEAQPAKPLDFRFNTIHDSTTTS